MRRNLWVILTALWLASAAGAALDLGEIGVGARPLSLGKAFVGLADDASAIFVNPAGLSRSNQLNLLSMSGSMLGDVNYLLLGASDLSPVGKLGIGFLNASVGGIPLTTITGSGSTAAISQYGTTDYSSSIIYFSYGSKLSRFLKGGAGGNVSLGASLKYFTQGFSGGGTPMQDAVGMGMDADLGLLVDANRWVSLGLTLQNCLPSSFGGRFIWQKNTVTEGIPLVVNAGAEFKMIGLSALQRSETQKLDLLFGYEKSFSQNRPAVCHFGVEYWPMEIIALRGGVDQKPKATEAGVGIDNNLTAGVGLFFNGVTFDYAFHQYGELSENTTHFFSLGFRGIEKAREIIKKRGERQNPTVPLPEVVPKPSTKSFNDVPDDYWARKPIEYLSTLGIMGGYENGSFKPTEEITRGEFVKIAAAARGVQPEAVANPDKPITRAEAAKIVSKYSGLYKKPKLQKKAYADIEKDHWASPAIAATKETGMFEYIGDRGFGPNMYLTRAEAAEIISKTPMVKARIDDLLSGGK
jgi:hypothetical protein